MKGYIEDKELGKIYVELRRGMTSVRFTYHPDGHLLMRAPMGVTVAELQHIVNVNRERLRSLPKPEAVMFQFGQNIGCFRCSVMIEPQSSHPGYILNRWEGETLHVCPHETADLNDEAIKKTISKVIGRAMEVKAEEVLLPYAREVADGLGLNPAGLEIGRGMRKLGHCTAKQVIQLSRNLMFLPEELIRYIICHELAHLTHMNHSPEFHALVNRYTGGKEKELERQLRQFRFPIIK
ncbi:MAG: M48 family metallopeptidase [Muribaculaceae bacterium]|nr:M48 family metallopeptidase [Muribaculaceae bacterium]